MTFNIRGGLGMDGPRDTTRIADLVNDENPDIVCFQEVHQRLPWSGWIDQPGRLTVGLRMPFVFQANLRVGFGGYGLGIATHYPIFSVARHRLPSRKEQRGALTILLETPHGPVNITCTHWGLDQDERRSQAAALTDILKNTTGPNIVCGDFNELTSVDYLQNFLAQNGLLDADSAQDRPTYPADDPRARIDAVLYSAALPLLDVRPVPTSASDHWPIVAYFG